VETHEDPVETFMWQLVLDPDAVQRIATLLGERGAAAILKVAQDYAMTMDGAAWLSSLGLSGAGEP
jgi:hypothetical protein